MYEIGLTIFNKDNTEASYVRIMNLPENSACFVDRTVITH